MEFLLLPLLSVFLLSCSGITSAQTGATVTVEEGSEAVLPCSIPGQDITQVMFDWRKVVQGDKLEVFEFSNGKQDLRRQDEQFNGRVFHFPDQLKFGNASIVIRNTKLSDSGNYSCDYSPDQPNRQTFYIELVVDCILKDRSEEKGKGACRKPYVTSLNQTRDWSLLQCKVLGVSPKPAVEWQDSSGNILHAEEPQVTERGGSYDIILQTTVSKTDNYSCVVTQEDICHRISAEIFMYIHGSAAGLAADVLFTFVITLVGLLAKSYITQN